MAIAVVNLNQIERVAAKAGKALVHVAPHRFGPRVAPDCDGPPVNASLKQDIPPVAVPAQTDLGHEADLLPTSFKQAPQHPFGGSEFIQGRGIDRIQSAVQCVIQYPP